MIDPKRPVSAHDVALAELRRLILTGAYAPGVQIGQEGVAARLGVSVIPVREALKSLEGEGQVVFVPRRGFFVAKYSREDLLELCEIRSALEGMAVCKGIDHVGADNVAEMVAADADMAAADRDDDMLAFLAADRRLHFALLRPGCGPQTLRVLTSLWDLSDHYRAAFLACAEHRQLNHSQHADLLDAVRARDVERILAVLDEHRLSALAGLPS